MTDLPPLPQQQSPPMLGPPPAPREKFVSARTQLESNYMAFKNPELSLVERVRAGHQFIDAGLGYVPDGEDKFVGAMRVFRRSYIAPRLSTSVVRNVYGEQVIRVFIGGESEAVSDFPIVFASEGLRILQDQLHEDYYNSKLSKAVAAMLDMLMRHGVLRKEPMEFRPSFAFLVEDATK